MPESLCHLIPIEIEHSCCFVVFGHYLRMRYEHTPKMAKLLTMLVDGKNNLHQFVAASDCFT